MNNFLKIDNIENVSSQGVHLKEQKLSGDYWNLKSDI